MTAKEIELQRRERERRIKGAYESLAMNPAFKIVWEEDLQRKFPPLAERFRSDEAWSPIPAAKRDGNGEVIAHIARRMGHALAAAEDEAPEKPTEAATEFQGVEP
jgi:broad specificity phosphatase PhoE